MTTATVKTEAIVQNGFVDTLNKPYSACMMTFSPHGGDDWVFGTTEEVRAYWNSLTCRFDFQWLVFDSEEEMLAYLKELDQLHSESLMVSFFKVEKCKLDEPPFWRNAEMFL